jgi:hypothetical protein
MVARNTTLVRGRKRRETKDGMFFVDLEPQIVPKMMIIG